VSRICYEEYFKLTIEYYLQYVETLTLVIGIMNLKTIYLLFFQNLGTKHRVIMWQTQCYFFHNYNK